MFSAIKTWSLRGTAMVGTAYLAIQAVRVLSATGVLPAWAGTVVNWLGTWAC